MKFTKKLKATIITLLALITITPTISNVEPVTANAKAKTVIAHKKSQFKKGYKYKYNKKKHVYIGHKKRKSNMRTLINIILIYVPADQFTKLNQFLTFTPIHLRLMTLRQIF